MAVPPDTVTVESVMWGSEALIPFAVIHSARGDLAALASVERQAELGTGSSHAQLRSICGTAKGVALAGRGAHEAAMAELEPYVRRPVTPYHQLALSTFLESALALGREDAVRGALAVVGALPPAAVTPTVRSQLQRFEGLLAARAGDAEAGARHLADAVATVRPVGRPFPLAKVLLEHGELLAATGDSEGAEEALREAQRSSRSCERSRGARADHALAEPARA